MSKYVKFFVMIATSTLVMFALMYLNTYAIDHVFFSETRSYMAVYMGAAMSIVMLLFMWAMYPGKGAKFMVLGASGVVFLGAVWLVRS